MIDQRVDNLTGAPESARGALLETRPTLLPFDPQDLVAMRVSRAVYAKMCMVSRQSVTDWVQKGWITVGPDGLLDPAVATRQLLRNADPARLRARIFREALATQGELRARIQSLEATVAAQAQRLDGAITQEELEGRLDGCFSDALDRIESAPWYDAEQMEAELWDALGDALAAAREPRTSARDDSRETSAPTSSGGKDGP